MTQRHEPYTQRDFSELAAKLKTLSKDLTPKENAFLFDAVESAGRAVEGREVQGFGQPYDEKGYTPESMGGADSAMESAAMIKVVIKGTFVSK